MIYRHILAHMSSPGHQSAALWPKQVGQQASQSISINSLKCFHTTEYGLVCLQKVFVFLIFFVYNKSNFSSQHEGFHLDLTCVNTLSFTADQDATAWMLLNENYALNIHLQPTRINSKDCHLIFPQLFVNIIQSYNCSSQNSPKGPQECEIWLNPVSGTPPTSCPALS